MNIKLIIILLFTVTIFACNNFTGEFRDIQKEEYTISLPDWLEETEDLAEHAHFQFKSMYRNTYGIIIKDNKDKSFKEYQKESINVLRNFKEITNLLVIDSSFSNNKISMELLGDIDSEKIFYWHNTYETETQYYQLVLWTRSFDRKQKYEDVIKK